VADNRLRSTWVTCTKTVCLFFFSGVNLDRCTPSIMKQLKKHGVDLDKSGLPVDCLEVAARRNQVWSKEENSQGIPIFTTTPEYPRSYFYT